MKKFFLIFAILPLLVSANIQKNLKKLVESKTHQEVFVEKVYDLKSDENLKIAILRDQGSKNQIPVVTNKSGNLLFVLTNVFFTDNNADSKLVGEILQQIQSNNDKQNNSHAINELFLSIPQDYVIKLDSSTKGNKKITYIVSDPMCPHCQDELRHINERLKDSNVYMIMVAYLGQESIQKAATILEKIKEKKTTQEKVELFQQVYSTTYKAKNPDKKEVKKVENITKKIADSALIRGVPFIYEYKK